MFQYEVMVEINTVEIYLAYCQGGTGFGWCIVPCTSFQSDGMTRCIMDEDVLEGFVVRSDSTKVAFGRSVGWQVG